MNAVIPTGCLPVEKAAPAALEELARQADQNGQSRPATILRRTALLLTAALREEAIVRSQ